MPLRIIEKDTGREIHGAELQATGGAFIGCAILFLASVIGITYILYGLAVALSYFVQWLFR